MIASWNRLRTNLKHSQAGAQEKKRRYFGFDRWKEILTMRLFKLLR